jgi:hypothetical protein
MVTALLTLLAGTSPLESVADYFPLNPGDEWQYVEEAELMTARSVDRVGEPIELGGAKVFPVITLADNKEIDRVFYKIGEGSVLVVAFSKDKPLLAPYPIIKSPELGEKWKHQGETYIQGALADLKLDGRVRRLSSVEFDGKKVEGIEVRLEATVLEEFGTKITFTQVATYGKGIGLIKMESTTKLPKKTVKATRRLVAYTPIKT